MPLDYDYIMNRPFAPVAQSYGHRDTILYALGLGAGIGAEDRDDLSFVYEEHLKALPTMAVVLAPDPFWIMEPETGITWQQVLHGEQRLRVHKPLPAKGRLIGSSRIAGICDKGAAKGAVLLLDREFRDAKTGELLIAIGSSVFLRADGGFGGTPEGAPKPHPVPDGAPDLRLDLPTRPEQALIYRLSGDWNPLHADPAVARQAGFDRPILHGLCSYGIAGRAVLKLLCGNDPARLKALDLRFSAPVYPGETIRTEVWHEGEGRAAFRCRVVERDLVCLNNGYAEYRA